MSPALILTGAALAAMLGLALLLATGVLGVGRDLQVQEAFSDVKYWYVSAALWLAGGNPYDFAHLEERARANGIGSNTHYASPPTSFWFGAGLQLLSYDGARWAWTAVNLLALVAIFFGVLRMVRVLRPDFEWSRATAPTLLMLVAIVIGTPYAANVVWVGQTTLVVTALLIWSWILIHEGHEFAGGLLFALGAIKPQISLLLGLWLLLDGRWRALATAAVASLLLSAVPFWADGLRIIPMWLGEMSAYVNEPAQRALAYNINLRSALEGFGAGRGSWLQIPMWLLCAGLVYLLWRGYRKYGFAWPVSFALLVPISLLTLRGRDYDGAACMGLVAVGIHVSAGRPARQLLLLALLALFCLPLRIVELTGVEWLRYWRPVVLLAITLLVFRWVFETYRPIPA